jgi:hypothetical protein
MTRRDKTELGAQLGVPESDLGDYTPRFQYRTDAALLRSQNHLREPRSDSGEGSVNSWAKDASQASKCSLRERRRCTSFRYGSVRQMKA